MLIRSSSVTVVIVNWNSGELLRRCLNALVTQTHIPDRVVVIDNASSDNSFEVVTEFPAFELIRNSSNLGFAAGNNLALHGCNTDFVALLNPDAFPVPAWLEHLLKAAQLFPDCAAFGSRQLDFHRPEQMDGIGDTYHFSGLMWREGYGKKANPAAVTCREIFSPCAAAALYRVDALKCLKGFDEDFFCYAEDVDLGFRLRLAGYKARYVPNAVVHHVGSATSGGKHSDFAVYHGHRNLVWTYFKNMPGILFYIFLPAHLALNIFTLLYFSWKGQARVIFRAKRDALLGLPQAWKKRKAVQANRVARVSDIWRCLRKGWR